MSPAAATIAKPEWRRPVIIDLGPPKRPPTAEKVAARHGEIRKHWRKQRQRRAKEKPEKPADVRLANLRWPELQRLMRYQYGTVLPDTAAARRDLEILINYALLTNRKPQLVAEIWAPWASDDELDQMAAQRPVLHTKRDLGQKLGLVYAVRHRLGILTIAPIDVDEDGCERLRRQRQNERKRERRAAAKQETSTMTTEPAPMHLKPRERKVLAKIDGAEIAVSELTRRLANLKEFKTLAKPRDEVYRVLDRLVAAGLVADRYAPGPRGGRQSRFVWRPQ